MSNIPDYMVVHGHRVPLTEVKRRIRRRGYRQVDVARAVGVHQTAVSRYLTGKDAMNSDLVDFVEREIFDPATAARVGTPHSTGTTTGRIPTSKPKSGGSSSGTTGGKTTPEQDQPDKSDDDSGRETVSNGKSDPVGNRSFPHDDALKVIIMAQKAGGEGHITYPASIRKAIQWQDAFYLLADQGFGYDDALTGSYDLVIRSKTEPKSEDRAFAEESFNTVFGLEADACKVPTNAPKDQHPGYSLALPFVEAGKSVWLYGPAGTGKTYTAEALAEATGRDSFTVQGTGDLTKDDFVGSLGAENGSTVKQYGPLILAMEQGAILILEEPSVVPAEILMTLQQAVDGKPVLVTGMGEVEKVTAKDGFAVIACDNTVGLGEGHAYVGTRRMNEAFRDRFLFIEYGHMSKKQMMEILKSRESMLFDAQGWS